MKRLRDEKITNSPENKAHTYNKGRKQYTKKVNTKTKELKLKSPGYIKYLLQ